MKTCAVLFIFLGTLPLLISSPRTLSERSALEDKRLLALEGFTFIGIRSIRDPVFLPGSSRYGDIGALINHANNKPWVVDSKGLPDWIRS